MFAETLLKQKMFAETESISFEGKALESSND